MGEKISPEAEYIASEIVVRGDYSPSILKENKPSSNYSIFSIFQGLVLIVLSRIASRISWFPPTLKTEVQRKKEPIKGTPYDAKYSQSQTGFPSYPINEKDDFANLSEHTEVRSKKPENLRKFDYKFGEKLFDPALLRIFLEDTGRLKSGPPTYSGEENAPNYVEILSKVEYPLWQIRKKLKENKSDDQEILLQNVIEINDSLEKVGLIWRDKTNSKVGLIITTGDLDLFANYLESINQVRNLLPDLEKYKILETEVRRISNLIDELASNGFIFFGKEGLEVISPQEGNL